MDRQKHENTMLLPRTSKDELDNLVSKLCEETQLMESTIRDLFAHGWEWRTDRWVKHRYTVGESL